MKLNFAYPATGCQKCIECDDDLKLRNFYEKRMAQEVSLDFLGDEWKGYVARIGGGNDKQGFPMKQGVLTNLRVRLLLKEGQSCYRARRDGERRRKSVKGCIVDQNMAVIHLVITKRGESEIPGLTDKTVPRRLGPKRANNIRKMFNLTKEDDVREFVVKRPLAVKEGKKERFKAPKIQRLITPQRLQRKRREKRLKRLRSEKSKKQQADYLKLLALRHKEEREARDEARRRRSSASRSESMSSAAAGKKPSTSESTTNKGKKPAIVTAASALGYKKSGKQQQVPVVKAVEKTAKKVAAAVAPAIKKIEKQLPAASKKGSDAGAKKKSQKKK